MKYSAKFRRRVVNAMRRDPWSVQAVADAFGISHGAVTQWTTAAGIEIPSASDRIAKANARRTTDRIAKANAGRTAARTGELMRDRRARAEALRAEGLTHQEIADTLRITVSSVHHALRPPKPTRA